MIVFRYRKHYKHLSHHLSKWPTWREHLHLIVRLYYYDDTELMEKGKIIIFLCYLTRPLCIVIFVTSAMFQN